MEQGLEKGGQGTECCALSLCVFVWTVGVRKVEGAFIGGDNGVLMLGQEWLAGVYTPGPALQLPSSCST